MAGCGSVLAFSTACIRRALSVGMYKDQSTAKRERDTVNISYSPLSPQVLVEESQTHEEADTLIPHQVLASVSNSANQKLCIWSPACHPEGGMTQALLS